ncbi:MAG TPA: peptidoglycan DD-metalloendopeptidase family protein [Aquabacterium sp.]|uniref:peptidoglycan DD-metalloendopeptidase family protein n=1 Tax=Aquabacterium sp. TaxID=1872578 RepID=UPI002E336341|nr:peptidoglycan DD-metalloendopeptidase family protein [Aquabacterium sp.]HEX5372731.1 peptidoglycan DD-metalloendopeptidase family protein [Aquabacterium sp.]
MYDTRNTFRLLASAAVVLTLVGCASPTHKAPVEDRGRVGTGLSSSRLPPGIENAGKPGYYTVKPGDTLIRVALESGQNWRDLAAWNNLDNPNFIEVGQVLRVEPRPGELTSTSTAPAPAVASGAQTTATATKPITTPKVESRSLDSKPQTTASTTTTTPAAPGGTPVPASAAKPATGAPAVASAPAGSEPAASTPDTRDADEPAWQWPASGPILGSFEEGKRKGMVLGGKAGDPVLAAADGRVVYAGSGLRGYGNLVIVKHNAQYLTAYAHNQSLLVKEDQVVRKGQKIAEMGNTDAERVQLHFEIRKQGKPIDPSKSLPAR